MNELNFQFSIFKFQFKISKQKRILKNKKKKQ
jgi:hypothetical protein